MFDLTFQSEREKLAATITSDVEAQSVEAYREPEPRWHLGASIIGHECERYAWNVFRWIKEEAFSGRMFRLFNRGHMEEARFVERLRGIGFEVFEVDGDGKQFRIGGCKGHFGGSLDGVAIAPARYAIKDPLLAEFKTHSDKSFAKLKKEGVRKSKPQHFAQMSSYGQAYGFKFGLYCAVNKNTDELYFEIVALDWNLGVALYQKAERVIFSQTPPAKVSLNPAFFTCKYCAFVGVCHAQQAPDVTCRSCEHAFPVEDGGWYCRVNDALIPRAEVPNACPQYRRIV